MSLRMGLRPLLVCSALLAFSHIAPAQVKVAVIDTQKAVFETAEIKKADADLQTSLKPRNDRALQLNTELQSIQQQLQTQGSKLTQQQTDDLQADGQRKQRELQRLQTELQEAADAARQEVVPRCTLRMKEVVKKLAEEKGVDLVVDTQIALYFKPAMDITADATAAYNKAYPAAAPAAVTPKPPAR
jgi:outer membrane protein